jgi:hypothetical protein
VIGFAKDPDDDAPYNSNPNLMRSWYCLNMNTNSEATLADGAPMLFNQSDFQQYFRPRTLSAYNSFMFTYQITNAMDENRVYNFTAILIVVDTDIPPLQSTYDPSYSTRAININENLEFSFTVGPTQDPDKMDFSTGIVYDFDTVGVMLFSFTSFRLVIWDYFSAFQSKTLLTLVISAYDPNF